VPEARQPQGALILARQQKAPESEPEFRHDPPLRLRSVVTCRPSPRVGDVDQGGSVQYTTRVDVPAWLTVQARRPHDELVVENVAEQDLDMPKSRPERSPDIRVPFVESNGSREIVAGGRPVRSQPVDGQPPLEHCQLAGVQRAPSCTLVDEDPGRPCPLWVRRRGFDLSPHPVVRRVPDETHDTTGSAVRILRLL
jgi:hypothetical protein